MKQKDHFKGRGAQCNTKNPYLSNEYVTEHIEGLDEPLLSDEKTQFFHESPKKIVNKVESPDVGLAYSLNPYQGCEHGCVYCYARNTHNYWGFSAGLDFERKIIVKSNAAATLEKQLRNPKWEVMPIMLAGNTDCYQPAERKLKITRSILEVLLKYRHPVSLITKNALILRDMDLLQELNKHDLVHVNVSITTLDESLRQKLEPRTATAKRRLQVVKTISDANIPVNVMVAPVIPGLNSHEIPEIIKAVADQGASSAAYTMVRLNGAIGPIFEDWIRQTFPDRADKVLHQIQACHGGQLNDSRFGTRMCGEGEVAEAIRSLFKLAKSKHLKGRHMKPLNLDAFDNGTGKQLSMF